MTVTLTLRGYEHSDTANGIRVLRPSNLWEAPDLRTNDTDMPGSHGAVAGVDLRGIRRVPITAQLRRDTAAEALAAMHDVVAAWAPGAEDVELTWTDATGDYVMFGRPRQAKPLMANVGAGIIGFECRFAATDPFIYSAVEHSGGTVAPTPPDGFVFPIVFPIVFGPAGVGGNLQINNAGTAPSARWRAVFAGPCSEPRISIAGLGLTYGGDLAAGQLLTIDGRARTVLLQGTSTVHTTMAERNWFALPPGDTEVQFSTADNQGALLFAHRDAWW